jgi:hypothetical protein
MIDPIFSCDDTPVGAAGGTPAPSPLRTAQAWWTLDLPTIFRIDDWHSKTRSIPLGVRQGGASRTPRP